MFRCDRYYSDETSLEQDVTSHLSRNILDRYVCKYKNELNAQTLHIKKLNLTHSYSNDSARF